MQDIIEQAFLRMTNLAIEISLSDRSLESEQTSFMLKGPDTNLNLFGSEFTGVTDSGWLYFLYHYSWQ